MDLLRWLRDTEVTGIDIDSDNRIAAHQKILRRKKLLQQVFTEFHHQFRMNDEAFFSGNGLRMELGAGVAPLRDSYADVLATDIVSWPGLDKVVDAQDMDLGNNSVRAIYGQNCFHHFSRPDLFFSESARVLHEGGGVILLEPYYGPIAKRLYKVLFDTEDFDMEAASWNMNENEYGPMNGANQALSYIVFQRDRKEFERKHPSLKIVHQELCVNYLKYLFSGGLNFKQLVPDWGIPIISGMQKLTSPFNRWIALHHVIVLRKESH